MLDPHIVEALERASQQRQDRVIAMEPSMAQGIEQHPHAAGFENPFKRRLILLEDIELSARLLAQVLPLRELRSGTPDSPWWHYGVDIALGSILVAAGIHPPMRILAGERPDLTLLLGYGGEQLVQQGSRHWSCPSDGCLLLCGEAYSSETTLQSALTFQLSSQRLLQTATTMAGLDHPPSPWTQAIEHSHAWCQSGEPAAAPLQALLRQSLAMANQVLSYSNALLDRLQFDDQIYRLIAALLLPDLRLESPLDRLTQKDQQGRDSFDELIDYIKLNLAQPLNLTMLESQSHYSRRALQYAFRERLGCTASQWIRSQRLDLARRHLQNPAPGHTVAAIATLCGYRSLSLFGVDFQQRFHVKPSQLLREARASQPSAGR
ncbi:MAG: AraC family transcriptional regulator [Prochlorococcaceae cyanobacterium]